MSDCGRDWGMDVTGGTCKGCWGEIFRSVCTGEKTLKHWMCQDAAYIAAVLDSRAEAIRNMLEKS